MSRPSDSINLPKMMVIGIIVSAGVFIIAIIMFIWDRLQLQSTDPKFQAIVVSAGVLIFFIVAAKVVKERW